PLRPLSPYAVSKVTQDLMGYQYFQSYRLPIVRTRAFNHEGPRRGDVFVTSNFARQIAEIEVGKRSPVIQVGNLKARRDYTDVRDIVRGYWRPARVRRSARRSARLLARARQRALTSGVLSATAITFAV